MNLQYSEPNDVADYLNVTSSTLTDHDLKAALINAMTRIDRLEKALARAERSARQAANTASCLANGIQPN